MNIISIDYTNTSDEDIKLICDKFELNYKQMMRDRKTYKLKKVFIDVFNNKLIAFTTKRDPLNVQFSEGAEDVFLKMPTYKIESKKEIKQLPAPKIDLNIDSILDKISKYGINSLLKEERDFLDKSSGENK